MKPISVRPCLTDLNNAINYNEIYEQLIQLSLCVYMPSNYIFASKIQKYQELTHNKGENLTQRGREQGICRLMSINLLKRLESSVHSFQLTLMRIKKLIDGTIQSIDQFERSGHADLDIYDMAGDDFAPSAKKSKSILRIWIGRVGVINFGKMQKFWSC